MEWQTDPSTKALGSFVKMCLPKSAAGWQDYFRLNQASISYLVMALTRQEDKLLITGVIISK